MSIQARAQRSMGLYWRRGRPPNSISVPSIAIENTLPFRVKFRRNAARPYAARDQ